MVTTRYPYNDATYKRYKQWLRTVVVDCWHGCGRRATSPDHDPPIAHHTHIRGTACCTLKPACRSCQCQQGGRIVTAQRSSGYQW